MSKKEVVHVSLNRAAPTQSRVNANFPEGLSVLVVDDNVVCLKVVAALLNKCRYKVTATTKATEALKMLRKNKESYDIVITDVIMLDMNGFELLEIIGLEMDMPVIMMSANDDKESVLKGVRHGARDYLIKPLRLAEVKNIWQHVVRQNLFNTMKSGIVQAGTDQNPSAQKKKKKRVSWTVVLHNKFVDAVRQLGVDKAVAKEILQIMNEPMISQESVANHLRKYKNALRKENTKAKMSQERENNINSNRTNGLLSDTITTSCIDQCLNTINHHNRFAEQDMSTGITSFGSRLQTFGASTSNAKLLQQNQLPPKVVADQMRPTVFGTVPPSQFFAANPSPHHEFNRMRFHSVNSRTKMFDDNVKMSSSYLPSFNTGQSGPSSMPVSFGPYSCPPAAFNLDDVPFQMLGDASNQLNPVSQPDSLAMLLPWQHEERNLANLKVKEEPINFPFDMQQITDDSIRKGQFVQHRYPFENNAEREIKSHHNNSSSSSDDGLLSIIVKQTLMYILTEGDLSMAAAVMDSGVIGCFVSGSFAALLEVGSWSEDVILSPIGRLAAVGRWSDLCRLMEYIVLAAKVLG
ncbi:two-component response regulator ARR18-like [Camellia sinensis]|uniref:two-component response regulator ARR18-like n=1 Tax=Camellia sinensis TaxID=4442 RepID=UPI0010361900|nr:two-component response regulator ARR18-like [Camellia sinensis]